MLSTIDAAAAAPPVIYMTEADHYRLSQLVSSSGVGPRGTKILAEELARAVIVRPGELPQAFAKLGSTVRYEDRTSGRGRTVQLVLPEAADIDQNRISVFTPVGAALLGLAVGQEFTWEAADRPHVLRILEVADGHETA